MGKRELSKLEQDTFVAALEMIDEAGRKQKLAEYKAAIEEERAGRVAAEAKVGELTAELAKRQEGYQAALANMETKLLQARESRATADMLAAQARAEADVLRKQFEELKPTMEGMRRQIEALMQVEPAEPVTLAAPSPSYRVNVVGRDAAGDLRTLEIIPVERT